MSNQLDRLEQLRKYKKNGASRNKGVLSFASEDQEEEDVPSISISGVGGDLSDMSMLKLQ